MPGFNFKPTILTALCVIISLGTSAHAKKPNVLLICVDNLKPLLDCYGEPHAKTPNLDKLAKRAVVMEAAYCNQPLFPASAPATRSFPRLRSGHPLFQRPSPQKQIPSIPMPAFLPSSSKINSTAN